MSVNIIYTMRTGNLPARPPSRGGVLSVKIECQILVPKSGKGFYLYIPLIEKRVFLEPVEQKLLAILMDTKQKPDNK